MLVYIYWFVLKIDPKKIDDPNRDIFVLSKGHGAPALFQVLAARGFFDESLLETFEMINEKRGDITLTYFEFATLSAFYLFSKSNLDVAVLEVGLGGRLDATNIVDSDVSIITSIGIDHTEFLGNTIDSIALEKAGVMRPFKKSIYAQKKPPAALLKYAKNKSVNLLIHDNDYQIIRGSTNWSIRSKELNVHEIPNLKMIGD